MTLRPNKLKVNPLKKNIPSWWWFNAFPVLLFLLISLGTIVHGWKESCGPQKKVRGQRMVSLHTLMRLLGRWGRSWPGSSLVFVWPESRGLLQRRRDGELSAPQLCRCRSSWVCFLRLLVIGCECDITCDITEISKYFRTKNLRRSISVKKLDLMDSLELHHI